MIRKMLCDRRAWFCIIVLESVIFMGGLFVLRRQSSVELDFMQDDLYSESGEYGFYQGQLYAHPYTLTPEFTLPKGWYTVEVQYELSSIKAGQIDVQYVHESGNNKLSGKIVPANLTDVSCDFRVKYDDRPMQVRGNLTIEAGEEDYITIEHVRIVSSPLNIKNTLFHLAVIMLTADILVLLYCLKDRLHIDKELKNHIKIMLLLIIFASIPLMINYLFKDSHDLEFHLTRIEELKEGLLCGMFPVRIQPGWMDGHGYAVSVFYGDLFLYIPALLRIFGVSLQTSYQFYVLLINTATVLIAYYCFRGMSNAKTGLACTIVYTLNIYRLLCIYTRAAVGEYTAMVFTPLVLYGLWKIYTLPEDSKEHEKSWITVAVGCSGIFLSHIITTEMTAFFAIITVIILWKKTFRKKTFLVLCKAAVVTVILSCWFLVPFLDYMLNGTYMVNSPINYAPYRMEKKSVFPAQFFMIDCSVMADSLNVPASVREEMPLTVGLSALSALVIWYYVCAGRKESGKSEKKEEYLAVFLCLLGLVMATWLFPYTWLMENIPTLRRLISSIQFPWRFYSIAGIMLAYLICLILEKEWLETNKKNLIMGILISLSFSQSLLYMSKCLGDYYPAYIYQSGNLSTFDVMQGEYLPVNGGEKPKLEDYVNQIIYDDDTVTVQDWYREKGAVVVSLANNGNEISQVEVPLLLYKGYHATDDREEELAISPGASNRISVAVPAGYSGTIRVGFREPWYWRICELISLITLLCLILYPFIRKNTKKTQQNSVYKNLIVDS